HERVLSHPSLDGQWGVTQHTAIPALLSTWGFYDVYCGYDATGSGINCGSVGLWASGDVLCSGAGFDCNNNDYFQPPPCGGSALWSRNLSATRLQLGVSQLFAHLIES